MFGVNGPLGFWVQRVTYLVDQNRVVRDRVKANFSVAEHEAFIRQAIELAKMAAPSAEIDLPLFSTSAAGPTPCRWWAR